MKKISTLGILLLLSHATYGQEVPPPEFVVSAPVFSSAPKIDGHLDDEVWRAAVVIDTFIEIEPDKGEPASEKTEVMIGYDEKNLYIGARCYTEPGNINAVMMQRDAYLGDEDSLHIVLDTFHDKRSGFYFAITPLGAQVDGLVRSDGDEVNLSWDGIWYSATSQDAEGWVAELAIPFRTLRFPKEEEQTWGLNLHRKIVHTREYVLWRPAESSNPETAVFKLSQAGELTGLKGLKQGRTLDIKPYVLARIDQSDTRGDDEDLEVGVDVKKGLTSGLTLDLTYNLDFAEAEADHQQINLTRFKLFFPEKRDFFLEGASLFYFGDRPDNLRSSQSILFFSRRIGLTEDAQHEVPVLGGAKISGRAGGMDIGFLNLTTDEVGELGEPRTSYTVLRLKRNILEKSSVGLMWLNKAVKNGADNSSMGFDWDFGAGKYFRTGGFLAKTSTPGLEGDDRAAMADVVWDSKYLFAKGSYTDIGQNFNPEMGFFPRLGIRESRGTAIVNTFPKLGNLRGVYFVEELVHVTDQNGDLESQNIFSEIDVSWNNFALIAFKFSDRTEVLKTSLEIHPGVFVPPGRYDFLSYFMGWQSIPDKPVLVFSRMEVGELYDGDFSELVLGFWLRPVRGLLAIIIIDHTDVDFPERPEFNLPARDFTVDLVSFNVTYAVSPTLSGRTLVEWRKDDNLDANIAVKWIYKPGAAFYLVYNERRDLTGQLGTLSGPTDRSFIAKATFFF